MLPELFIQQLKQSCDMERIVSGYLPLKKKGRYLVGLCPFHSEKSPSFYVYPQNQSFYCFGCGAGGDVITFIRRIENLEYMEAVKLLADRCGLELPMDSDQSDARSMLKKRVLEINRESARFFHSCLMSEQGRQAYEYLISRGRDRKTIRHFGLGYAPAGWDGLLNHLRAKGFSDNDMLEANVVTKGKYGPHDRFSNRVIFPIIDLRGNVVAFGGRALDDKGAKYLNSSDTPVFKKSKTLFALNFAKTSKRPGLILAEGYMDVIAIHQAGFDNAVATLGTALTEEQARLISQYAERVVLAYDSDGPGQAATKRAMNIFDEVGVKVSVLSMTGAKDPDEYIKKYGAERFKALLDGVGNALDFRLGRLRSQYDLAQDAQRLEYVKEAVNMLAERSNPTEQEVYAGRLAEETNISKTAIMTQLETAVKRAGSKHRWEKKQQALKSGEMNRINVPYSAGGSQALGIASAQQRLLAAMLREPHYIDLVQGQLTAEQFVLPQQKELFEAMLRCRQEGIEISLTTLRAFVSEEALNELSHLAAQYSDVNCTPDDIRLYLDRIARGMPMAGKAAHMSNEELSDYLQSMREKKQGNVPVEE